jgi:hypothetical protein
MREEKTAILVEERELKSYAYLPHGALAIRRAKRIRPEIGEYSASSKKLDIRFKCGIIPK